MTFIVSPKSYTATEESISLFDPLTITTSDPFGGPLSITSSDASNLTPVAVNSVSSPLVTSVNLTYSKPVVSVYEDVESNPRIHRKVIKYYYGETIGEWLYDELLDLLNYLTVSGDKVSVISSMSKYSPTTVDKDTQKTIEKKIDFIDKYFFKVTDMGKILYKYIEETDASWYELSKHEYFIRQLVKENIRKKLRKVIADKSK